MQYRRNSWFRSNTQPDDYPYENRKIWSEIHKYIISSYKKIIWKKGFQYRRYLKLLLPFCIYLLFEQFLRHSISHKRSISAIFLFLFADWLSFSVYLSNSSFLHIKAIIKLHSNLHTNFVPLFLIARHKVIIILIYKFYYFSDLVITSHSKNFSFFAVNWNYFYYWKLHGFWLLEIFQLFPNYCHTKYLHFFCLF